MLSAADHLLEKGATERIHDLLLRFRFIWWIFAGISLITPVFRIGGFAHWQRVVLNIRVGL